MKTASPYMPILLVWLFLTAAPAEVGAQNGYRTDLLQILAEKTGLCPQLDTLGTGEYYSFATFKSHPVTAMVAEGRVIHLGCTIFTPMQREGIGRDVCNFLERYCLELIVPAKPDFSAKQRMQLDGVRVLKGSLDPTKLQALCNDTTIFINLQTTPRGYAIGWHHAEDWIELISFPMEYDLLFGTDMDERERRLPEEICREANEQLSDTLPDKQTLVKAWQDNYYTLQAGTYLLPSMKADRYFEIDKDGQLRPIYNKVFPIESLANLFTSNLIDHDFTIDMHLRKYGLKTDTVSVPLKKWIDYCRKTGCKPFFGIINLDEEKASCELIMQNASLGYNHIMRIEFPLELMESRKGHITARLNSYVNSSRIKNLFDDNNQPQK